MPVVNMSTSVSIVSGAERAITVIVDVINRGGQHFMLKVLDDFRRRLGMRAPFKLQFEMVRSDAALCGPRRERVRRSVSSCDR